MDEDTLPLSSHATTIPSSPPLDPRYRAVSPTSSEPPLFSSDGPLDGEDLINYQSPRLKRKRAGPWYEQEFGRILGAKKTKLSRNFDSGVFMMSDGSFGSDGSIDLPASAAAPAREETRAERIARETRGMRQEEVAMYRRVHDLVEAGKNTYDLSAMNLGDSDLSNLRPITTLIQAPLDAGVDVPTEGQYRSMIPKIHLYLEDNNLSSLEPTLFDLQHLTSLNLTRNQIQELPPQIARLTSLETLNLTGNQLQWLPCEILSLFQPTSDHLLQLNVFANPADDLTCDHEMRMIYASNTTGCFKAIHTAADLESNIAHAYLLLPTCDNTKALVWLIRSWETRLEEYESPLHHRYCPSTRVTAWRDNNDFRIRFIGATPPSYFDTKGSLLPGSPIASTSEVIIHTQRGAWGMPATFFPPPPKTKTTSLVNLAIRKALGFYEFTINEIRDWMDQYEETQGVPQPIERLLRRAEGNFGGHADYSGLSECHVCGDTYLVPAAEWFEVWSPGTRQCVKVRVQVCSWACVPDGVRMQPKEVLDLNAMEE
jgi:hypothetical protein